PGGGLPAPRRAGPQAARGRGVTRARSREPSAPGAAPDPPGRSGAGPRPSLARAHGSAYRRADRLAVRAQRLVLRVVLQVDGELVDPERGELAQELDVPHGRTDDAEPVDDTVGDKRGVR